MKVNTPNNNNCSNHNNINNINNSINLEMCISFPLYDKLEKKLECGENVKLPEMDDVQSWRKICTMINSVSLEDSEAILQLIYHHYLNEQEFFTSSTEKKELIVQQLYTISETRKNIVRHPYLVQTFANTTNGKGMMFNLVNLPDKLQKIIALYILS